MSKALCLSGTPIALTDNMVFSFTFTGGSPDLEQSHLKVNFLDASQGKVGNLLSQVITAAPAVVTQAVTPTPVTPTPVTPGPFTPTPVVPTEPATSPSSGNTTLPAPGDNVVVTMPPLDTGTTNPVPVPPPLLATPPVVELEPVSAGSDTNEVPEPQSIALLLGGLALIGVALRKRG